MARRASRPTAPRSWPQRIGNRMKIQMSAGRSPGCLTGAETRAMDGFPFDGIVPLSRIKRPDRGVSHKLLGQIIRRRHRAGAAVALTLEVGPAVRIRFPPAASLRTIGSAVGELR